jgi:hypothetical protein
MKLERCECGQSPIKFVLANDSLYFPSVTVQCECGKVGPGGGTFISAAQNWNRYQLMKQEADHA